MEELIKILSKYGFSLKYDTLHTSADIEKYKNLPDSVSNKKLPTIYSPEGFVMGRLFHKESTDDKMSSEDYLELIKFFTMFKVKNSEKVLNEISKLHSL